MTDARTLLERYAASDPDHVVLNFTHGAYSPKAFAALRAVLDLHQPVRDEYMAERYGGDWASYDCAVCLTAPDMGESEPFPCPTVKAITAALAGEGE